MKRHDHLWQQFANSGNPMTYLAYKKSSPPSDNDNTTIKPRHADH